MTGEVLLSPRARADLDDIWDYSAERWGDERAESYLRGLWAGMKIVAGDPRRGRPCDDIRAGYFKYAVGSHVLFYRPVATGVDVIRVLHRRMDFDRHL